MADYPLIRLDPNQTKLWWLNTGGRMLIARVFSKRYGTCIVLTDTCHAVATITAKGEVQPAQAPYRRFEMHQIFNQPTIAECHCADFYDPEVGGPWRLRNTKRHHPMCIYDRPAQQVFDQFARINAAPVKEIEKEVRKLRPDAWIRARAEIEGGNVTTLPTSR